MTTGFILAQGGPLGGMIGWFMQGERCITKTICFLLIQQLPVKLLHIRSGFEWLNAESQMFIILAPVISFFGDLRAPTISLCRTDPGQPWPVLHAPWCHHVERNNEPAYWNCWIYDWRWTWTVSHIKKEKVRMFFGKFCFKTEDVKSGSVTTTATFCRCTFRHQCRVYLVMPQTCWRSCSCYRNFHQMKWKTEDTHTRTHGLHLALTPRGRAAVVLTALWWATGAYLRS